MKFNAPVLYQTLFECPNKISLYGKDYELVILNIAGLGSSHIKNHSSMQILKELQIFHRQARRWKNEETLLFHRTNVLGANVHPNIASV